MTLVINLVGQPGTGKTTTMTELFCILKKRDIEVELCPEWVKKWAWEGRKIDKYGQIYISGKEISQQSRLFNKVDYIISDSPVFLSAFYNNYYMGEDYLLPIANKFVQFANEDGVSFINIFLERNKKYNPKGMYQSEAESDEVGVALKKYMVDKDIPCHILGCLDDERVSNILALLGLTN